MGNDETGAARSYLQETKHSYESVRTVPHFLDWDNQPLPFKIYRDLEKLSLPDVGESSDVPALSALERRASPAAGGELGISELARLLHYAAGVTKRLRHPGGGEMLFRAAACTGALYHVELYVAAGPLEGLEAGLYHYGPRDHALFRLRSGDWRSVLVEASGTEPAIESAAAIVVFTSTYWRNAWKYRARAYRHAFWDSGTLLANLFAEASAIEVPAHLVLGFADSLVNRLLAIDADKEAALGLVALGNTGGAIPPAPGPAEPLELETVPLSREEVDYPAIREIHRASSLETGEEARAWREGGEVLATRNRGSSDDRRALEPLAESERPADAIETVIRRRGSSRRFRREPIDYRALSTILASATEGTSGDVLPAGEPLNDIYVIVNAVDGLSSGAYAYHPKARMLELLEEGDFRDRAAFLDLEQELAGDASVNVYMLVSLDRVLERFGNRGYRLAELDGGLLGGKIYLASYALGLGASGLTFYDDAVTEFFSPHAAGKSVMFLIAVGVPGKRGVLFQR